MYACKILLLLGMLTTTAWGQGGLLISSLDKHVPQTLQDLRAIEQAAQQVAGVLVQCTVSVQIGASRGSGVIISEDGYVLTAAHVIGGPGRGVLIRLPDGRDFEGETLGVHTTADGGLVKISNPKDLPFAPMAPEDQPLRPGQWCLAAGHPSGFMPARQPPVRLGRVIGAMPHVLRTECTITGGDSGGPLFDMKGQVIGIHSRIGEAFTDNFHVPVASFREAWPQLVAGKNYPAYPGSALLSMLDKDEDGKLTRSELKGDLEREVFDRLAENFELDTKQPLVIREIARDKFGWRAPTRLRLPRVVFTGESASDSVPPEDYMRGTRIQRLLRPTMADVVRSTVRVKSGAEMALGVVVDKDGYVITKASKLGENISCRFHDGRKLVAKLIAKDPYYDVALLRVEGDDFVPADWNTATLPVGSWLFTPNAFGRVVTTGVISVPSRKIDRVPPVMGIKIDPRYDELRVELVYERSGAEKAGVQPGDLITQVNDKRIDNFPKLVQALAEFQVGDRVDITVSRKNETIKLDVMLGARGDVFLGFDDFRRLSGDLSKLRDGFPSAFQTDAIVPPDYCGGPVVDISGKVVGINIARSDRIASLCIPYHDLGPLIEKLKSAE